MAELIVKNWRKIIVFSFVFYVIREIFCVLLNAILNNEVERLIITHKDRLLRFRSELVFSLCEAKGCEVVILNKGKDSTFEEDLAKDVLEIITVFSARLYGSRSNRNKKLLESVSKTCHDTLS